MSKVDLGDVTPERARVREAALEVVRAAGLEGQQGSVTIHLNEQGEPKTLESRALRKL